MSLLQEEIAKDPKKWQFPDVEFGTDLATEHERWLAEVHAGGRCVFVYDYPRSIKSFYMRDNDDGKTVAAFDSISAGRRRASSAARSARRAMKNSWPK